MNYRKLKWILEEYCRVSSQMAILDKYCLFFSPNTPLDIKGEIYNILGINLASCLGKYLAYQLFREDQRMKLFLLLKINLLGRFKGGKTICCPKQEWGFSLN